jgi:hypothetical protein
MRAVLPIGAWGVVLGLLSACGPVRPGVEASPQDGHDDIELESKLDDLGDRLVRVRMNLQAWEDYRRLRQIRLARR